MNLPLPEAPDERVAAILDNLRDARARLADAENTQRLIEAGETDDETPAQAVGYLIELGLAIDRVKQWAVVVRKIEAVCAHYGIEP